jgi:hypothetical protein
VLTHFTPVYCNSLLAMLNARDAIREKGNGGSHGISLSTIGGSGTDNRKVSWSVLLVFYRHSPNHCVRKLTSRPRSLVPEPTDHIARESNPMMVMVAHHSFSPSLTPTTLRRLRTSIRDEHRPGRLSGHALDLHRACGMVCSIGIGTASLWCLARNFYVHCTMLVLAGLYRESLGSDFIRPMRSSKTTVRVMHFQAIRSDSTGEFSPNALLLKYSVHGSIQMRSHKVLCSAPVE